MGLLCIRRGVSDLSLGDCSDMAWQLSASADCKSAIRQSPTLRYFDCATSTALLPLVRRWTLEVECSMFVFALINLSSSVIFGRQTSRTDLALRQALMLAWRIGQGRNVLHQYRKV